MSWEVDDYDVDRSHPEYLPTLTISQVPDTIRRLKVLNKLDKDLLKEAAA